MSITSWGHTQARIHLHQFNLEIRVKHAVHELKCCGDVKFEWLRWHLILRSGLNDFLILRADYKRKQRFQAQRFVVDKITSKASYQNELLVPLRCLCKPIFQPFLKTISRSYRRVCFDKRDCLSCSRVRNLKATDSVLTQRILDAFVSHQRVDSLPNWHAKWPLPRRWAPCKMPLKAGD